MTNPGVPSRSNQDRWLSTSKRAMLFARVLLLGGGWIVMSWLDKSSPSLWQDLSGTNPDGRESSDVVRKNKVNTVRRDAEPVVNRLESLEHDFNNDMNLEPDVAPSVQAIDDATALASAAQLTKTRQNLRKLRTLQSAWEVQSAAIRSGDLGRRIASSEEATSYEREVYRICKSLEGKVLATIAECENSLIKHGPNAVVPILKSFDQSIGNGSDAKNLKAACDALIVVACGTKLGAKPPLNKGRVSENVIDACLAVTVSDLRSANQAGGWKESRRADCVGGVVST